MPLKQNFILMAQYNSWMNERLYNYAADMGGEKIKEPAGAFFGSIFGTLNHILVGDTFWLKRFAEHPAGYGALAPMLDTPYPSGLNHVLYTSFDDLKAARKKTDAMIIGFCDELTEADLDYIFPITNTRGEKYQKQFGYLLQHFFNHQTHHRGQISTLFNQQGIDIGVTDLVAIIPEA